jgi:hypothetical protein
MVGDTVYIKKCSCGAVTIISDEGNVSIPYETYKKLYSHITIEKRRVC